MEYEPGWSNSSPDSAAAGGLKKTSVSVEAAEPAEAESKVVEPATVEDKAVSKAPAKKAAAKKTAEKQKG